MRIRNVFDSISDFFDYVTPYVVLQIQTAFPGPKARASEVKVNQQTNNQLQTASYEYWIFWKDFSSRNLE